MPYLVKRKVGLVIDAVRSAGTPGHYYIDAFVDGAPRSILVVVDEEVGGIEPQEEDYEEYLGQYVEKRHLPGLVLRVHRGERVEFPLDLRALPPKHYDEE